MMTQTDFTVENRLPLPAVFFLIIVSIKRVIKEFWALGAVFLVQGWRNKSTLIFKVLLALAVFVGFAILRGVLLYIHFSYVVKHEQLIVKKGIFRKTVLTIPLHRIQNISITQGFWQQVLGITTLCVDTAGTADKEMEIYLDKATSNALKAFLEKYRAQYIGAEASIDDLHSRLQPEGFEAIHVYNYDTKQLITASLTRNHIKGFGIFIAVLYAFFSQLNEIFLDDFLQPVQPVVHERHSILYWVFVVITIFLLSMMVNFVHICLKYYDLTVKLYGNRIKYEAGLIKRMEQIINLDKVQMIRETSNLLENVFRISTLKLLQYASFGSKSKNEITFTLPGFQQSKQLTGYIYDTLYADCFSTFYPQKHYLFRNFYRYALYPSLILALGALFYLKILILVVAWFVLASVCAYFRFRKSKSEIGNEYIRVFSGMIGEVASTVKIRNIQSVTLKQSVFQARKQTASVIIATRWDNMVIPFVKEGEAKSICNYLLYKMES